MDIVDSKYIGLISSRLQKFKRVKADLYNFRCPICGDSQKTQEQGERIFLSGKDELQTINVTIVEQVYHSIIF